MNCDRIGEVAGIVWSCLNEKGAKGIPLTDIKKIPDVTADEALAGLGWLAREGKLNFKTQAKKLCVSLTGDPVAV